MIEFTKMHGLGNDFIMLDGTIPVDLGPAAVARLCDRHLGVGADGLIVVTPTGRDTVSMQYWNADGSPAEMCGNGLRCTAWYAHTRGWVAGPDLTVNTRRGPLGASITDQQRIRVDVGEVTVGDDMALFDVDMVTATVGNPHAVTFVTDLAAAPVETLGKKIGTDPAFPSGTNVEFAAVTDAGLDLRVWERGVGETLACGSGAAAAAAVAIASGRATSPVSVHLSGGELLVEVIDGRAYLTGPVAVVFEGRVNLV